ncbi:efflux RND transporter periplasmic adaptor subunit, partial [Fibrobacterales bacterium]|nr:efflux RND transporter periplasmic adaptor subunit [Fibrobacterales bacterium]
MKTKSIIIICLSVLFISGLSMWIGSQLSHQGNNHIEHNHSELDNDLSTSQEQAPEIWTCSMHPQIKLPKYGKCPLCAMDLILLEQKNTKSDNDSRVPTLTLSRYAQKLASVHTSIVIKSEGQNKLELQGEIKWNQKLIKSQSAWFEGRIDKLKVSYAGQYVKKGQVIAEVYSPTLYNATQEWKLVQDSNNPQLKQAILNKLNLLGISPKEIKSLSITNGSRVKIRASHSGVVKNLNVSEGDYIQKGMLLFTLGSTKDLWVQLNVFENDISSIQKNQQVELKTESLTGQSFKAKVEFIHPILDQNTRTIQVRLSLRNTQGLLKPGMLMTAKLSSQASSKLLIPETAPLITGKQAFVYVEESPGVYSGRIVTLGGLHQGFYEVLQGLTEGEVIVSRGAFKIDAAMQIQALPSMMYPEGAISQSPKKRIHPTKIKDIQQNDSKTKKITLSQSERKWMSSYYSNYLKLQKSLNQDNSPTAFIQFKKLIT